MNTFQLNKSDYKIIGGYLIIATMWLLFKFYVDKYTLIEYFIDIPVFWLQILGLLYLSKQLFSLFFIKKINYVVLVILALVGFWLFGFLAFLSGELTRDGFISYDSLIPYSELILNSIHSSVANLSIPLTLISVKKYYEYQLRTVTFSNTQKELELKLLKTQFNPHFLYNSLNTIDALVDHSSKKEVKEYISNLSGLYRYLIESKDDDITSLEEEMILAKKYCYIIETRFGNDYKFIFQNGNKYNGKYLPNGALLTALENIVKHNASVKNTVVIATITINEEEIKVSNSISKTNNNTSLGTGLLNLKKRYYLLSDKLLKVEETEEEFVVTLPLLTLID